MSSMTVDHVVAQLSTLVSLVDLTEEALASRIAPAIDTAGGASSLYDRMAQTLYRTQRQHVLLTGETGVGKTELAKRLAEIYSTSKRLQIAGKIRVFSSNPLG